MTGIIEAMVTAVILALAPAPPSSPYQPPPNYYDGSLSRYDPGVMADVLHWRHSNGIPDGFDPYHPQYVGYIAVVDCRNVGREAWLTLTVEGETRQPVLVYVADCTSPGTPAAKWMIGHQIAAEIDYDAWVQLGIVDGRGAWAEVVLVGE